ncbi:virulence factor TspB C-terminal domain-related protein [Acinetobacter junii]|uniref:virulence factor TspB C-terminal domain-related protein n=1 Tax=Acinetobacter junii TaxID=40215 RepID=UPI0034CFF7EA
MKKIISIFICIQIALFPTFLFAGVLAGTGWSIGDRVAKGASTIVNGTKNVVINGKNYIKTGTATITPTATQVAKVLARGGAGYALSVAVEQLLGSVDWVLDPANNSIRYWEPADPNSTAPVLFSGISGATQNNRYLTAQEAASAWYSQQCTAGYSQYCNYKSITCPAYTSGSTLTCKAVRSDNKSYTVSVFVHANPAYDPDAKGEEKSIPLNTVAQKVISNAENGDTQAQVATTAAAADIINEAEKDNTKARPIANQLDANATTKPADAADAEKANEAQGEAKPNEANPEATDLSLTFPIFCDWAPTICEAAQTVINFPNTLTDWWETSNTKADSWASSISEAWASVKDWATNEPDLQQQEQDLPIDETPLDRDPSSFDTSYVTFGAQCPVFDSYEVSVGPISKSLSMDLTPLCQFAEKVRPAILGMSYLTAAGIVVAAIRET